MESRLKKIIIVLVLVVILAGVLIWRLLGKSDFDQSRIEFKLDSPTSVASGENFTIRIVYANHNKIPLKNVVLVFDKPDQFEYVRGGLGEFVKSTETNLGVIDSGSVGEAKIKGSLVAPKDAEIKFKFHLKFSPGDVSAVLENTVEAVVTISSTPIAVSATIPETAVSGYPMEYKISLANQTSSDFQKVAVFVDYPKGFSFISASPVPVLGDNRTWNMEDLKGAEKKDIDIKGVLAGEKDEVKDIKISIGTMSAKGFVKYDEIKGSSHLILPPINLIETVNDSISYNANPGEELETVIKYRNNSADNYKDLRIESDLRGEVLDFNTLNMENGMYDEIPDIANAAKAHLTWDSRSLPDLASLAVAEEKEVRLRIKVKDKLPLKDSNSKNFLINNAVKVYGKTAGKEESMITDTEFITKLSSKLILNAKAYYNDDGRIVNDGPIPPRVGQQTNFTVHWQALNLANDARDVKVKAILPRGIIWTNKIIPSGEDIKIEYDAVAGVYDLTWNIGDMAANTGIFSPVREVIFQVGIKPEMKDVGDYLMLVGNTEITGTDNFTGVPLKTTREEITTRLFDDISIGPEEGKIIP